MDFVQVACLYLLLRRIRRKKKKIRQYWTHPFTADRIIKGFFYQKYNELRMYPKKFFGYYRMKIQTFDRLLRIVGPHIEYKNTRWRNAVPAEERLSVTLRYLASGNSFYSFYYEYLLGATTIREIVEDTCEKLWFCLHPLYMPEPKEDDWLNISEGFYKRTNFPNCLGAVDGKHIRLEKPNGAGSEFFNYKQYNSIVLMAVADSNYSFIMINVGAYGSSSDSTIFKQTNFAKKLENDQLNIPQPRNLPNDTDGPKMPFVFVGDEAFALSKHIMRPYPRRNLSIKQRVFNYRLTRARRMVECTFGICTNKWRILHRSLDVKIEFCDKIVKACCILHNFVRKYDGIRFKDELYACDLRNMDPTSARPTTNCIEKRDYFGNYFTSSSGSIPWQYNKI